MSQGLENIERKPDWLKVKLPTGENYKRILSLSADLGLHTVCEEAHCPNIGECWGGGTATFMLLGDLCTRGCRFCAVKSGNPMRIVDDFEPLKVAYALRQMKLRYVVLTSVDRDDLPDGGAGHFARTIVETRRVCPEMIIEVLTPDFQGDQSLVNIVVKARPEVFSHNLETVERLQSLVRDRRANYFQSLRVLETVKMLDPTIYTKSSLMLGLGEKDDEVVSAMKHLRNVGVDLLAIGQYLRPSNRHIRLQEYIHPSKFEEFRNIGKSLGFRYVASGPLVRTSYRAGEFFIEKLIKEGKSPLSGNLEIGAQFNSSPSENHL